MAYTWGHYLTVSRGYQSQMSRKKKGEPKKKTLYVSMSGMIPGLLDLSN